MQYNLGASGDEEQQKGKSLIVKRMDLTFNDIECQVLSCNDITAYKRLEEEEEMSRLLKALNASVHHEMIGPLKTSVDICKRLIGKLPNKEEKRMIQTVLISSQLVLFHANDLLDKRIIENGGFVPDY